MLNKKERGTILDLEFCACFLSRDGPQVKYDHIG